MPENVVYILGAGFSAPLGLPVVSNFYEKSHEMSVDNVKQYEKFSKIFSTRRDLSHSKNYFSTDLFNIEEVLSILEMRSYLDKDDSAKITKEEFIQYIKDVIEYYTPKFSSNINPDLFPATILRNSLYNNYANFVASINNLEQSRYKKGGKGIEINEISDPPAHYSLISLNYDLVIEKICDVFNNVKDQSEFSISRDKLVKLHGSLESDLIVLPTWNKGIGKDELSEGNNENSVIDAWQKAYKMISEADQIRFMGYSLPANDSYIRYLLRAAVIENEKLDKIDVLCLDVDGSVEKRFREFIHYRDFRFASKNIESYLQINHASMKQPYPNNPHYHIFQGDLEKVHKDFFKDV